MQASERRHARLADVLLEALWLGTVGFGGGLAVLSMIEQSALRRGWLTRREFTHTAAIAQTLPGSASANCLTYLGLRLFGYRGAALAAGAFVLPSAVLMCAFAGLYERVHAVPHVAATFRGLAVAVVGLILSVTVRMGRDGLRRRWQVGVAASALLLEQVAHMTVLEVALGGVVAGLLLDTGHRRARLFLRQRSARGRAETAADEPADDAADDAADEAADEAADAAAAAEDAAEAKGPPPRLSSVVLPALAAVPLLPVLVTLLLVFARIGAATFGGGFTMVPFVEQEAVHHYHWLNATEFADAVALGQVTPGPVLITATFIGWRVAGLAGAAAATLGIFLVPWLLTVFAGSWVLRHRNLRSVRSALRGLVPAVVGLMAAAALSLGETVIDGNTDIAIASGSFLALYLGDLNPALVIFGGGLLRLAIHHFGGG